jgi:hypothetical protein
MPKPGPKINGQQVVQAINAYSWALENIEFIDGHAFGLKDFPNVLEFYEDTAQTVVAQKCAQYGLTVAALVRYTHRAAVRGLRGIYFLPTDDFRNKFVNDRYNSLIGDNPKLRIIADSTDNVSQKKFGNTFIYFLGLKGAVNAFSTPCDCEVFDEVDRIGDKVIEVALKRMAASPYKEVDYVCTPTLPNYGINKLFLKSDQKYWMIKCGHCNHWQCTAKMDFPRCIEPGYLRCEKCGLDVDAERRINGEWDATATPVEDISGYQFCRLDSPVEDYRQIFRDYKSCINLGDFFNQILGLPYEDYESSVSAAHVLTLCGSTVMQFGNTEYGCSMGVDIGMASGKGKHVIVSRQGKNRLREVVWVGTVDKIEKLVEIISKFGVRRFVIDAGPQRDLVEDFVKRYPGKGWMCVYNESQKTSFTWNEETQIVAVNRTQSLDASQRVLRESNAELPRRCEAVEQFADHCASIARQNEQDPDTGIITPRWIHRGPDDYRHAWNYDCLCWMQYGTSTTAKSPGVVKVKTTSFFKPIKRTSMKLRW